MTLLELAERCEDDAIVYLGCVLDGNSHNSSALIQDAANLFTCAQALRARHGDMNDD